MIKLRKAQRKLVITLIIVMIMILTIIVTSNVLSAATLQQTLSTFVDSRYGMFIHFNMGTFTDEEWASPNQSTTKFAPTNVDTDQWAQAAYDAKMKFGILTTKHHDGFCLWPTAYTSYNVMNSDYKQDIVKKYTESFRAKGLKVGLYFSVWDRTQDVQAYNNDRHSIPGIKYIDQSDIDYTLGQIRELMTNYGTIDIFVTDGYGWQAGQQAVPYQKIRELVKSLQPNCVMIDHGAISEPFIGDALYFEEPLGVSSPAGNTYASCQGQTISGGWFWHPSTPTESLMSKDSIVSHLNDLQSKWTTFILNCPPNRTGKLDTNIVNRLKEVAAVWSPNTSRAALPTQQLRTEYPVTPRSAYASDCNPGEEASNAVDGRNDLQYETCWSTYGKKLPQSITVDLGGVWSNVSTMEYLPKQWNRNDSTNGDITNYTIYTSTDGVNFNQKVTGTWDANKKVKLVEWSNCNVGYVRIQVNAATGGYANISELRIGGRSLKPQLVSSTNLFNTTDYFKIINYTNKMALDSGGNVASGSTVKQRSWDGSNNLQWQIIDLGTGYYKIINRENGLAVDGGGSVASGSVLKQWTWDGSNNLQWQLQNLGQGFYRLVNRTNGFAIDSGGNVASGSDSKQWSWDGSNNLRWRIEKVSDTYSQ